MFGSKAYMRPEPPPGTVITGGAAAEEFNGKVPPELGLIAPKGYAAKLKSLPVFEVTRS
jgi:hypothetical protein